MTSTLFHIIFATLKNYIKSLLLSSLSWIHFRFDQCSVNYLVLFIHWWRFLFSEIVLCTIHFSMIYTIQRMLKITFQKLWEKKWDGFLILGMLRIWMFKKKLVSIPRYLIGIWILRAVHKWYSNFQTNNRQWAVYILIKGIADVKIGKWRSVPYPHEIHKSSGQFICRGRR